MTSIPSVTNNAARAAAAAAAAAATAVAAAAAAAAVSVAVSEAWKHGEKSLIIAHKIETMSCDSNAIGSERQQLTDANIDANTDAITTLTVCRR